MTVGWRFRPEMVETPRILDRCEKGVSYFRASFLVSAQTIYKPMFLLLLIVEY
jgi:hypothetical protein